MAQVVVHTSSHPQSHPCVRLDGCSLLIPHYVLFRVFLLSLLLLLELWFLPFLFHVTSSRQYPTGTPPNEESGLLANKSPLTNFERSAVDKNQRVKQREQRRLGDCLPRIVHEEPAITLRSKCCWNLQKVDILFSVQRLHCPLYSQEQRTWKTVDTLRRR